MSTPSNAPALLAGIDIGGTKIGLSVGTLSGEILATDRFPTTRDRSPQSVMSEALTRLTALCADHGAPAALGLACPGPMSGAEGRFLDPPNMPAWHGFELLAWLRAQATQPDPLWGEAPTTVTPIAMMPIAMMPIAMMNDANAAALAEHWWGAARGTQTSIFLTMSTGMGAGLVLNGRLHEGVDELAGEIGHLDLTEEGPVGFGKRGSVEGWLSGSGMAQVARAEALAALQRGEASALLDGPALRPDIDAQRLCQAADEGDPAARRAVDRVATALGRLAALLTDLLNPEIITVGTIGEAWPHLFLPGAQAELEARALPRSVARVRLAPSGLGAHRGHLSALAVARHHLTRHRLEAPG